MKSSYENISIIRNVSLIFANSNTKNYTLKKIEKIHMDSKKSMNSFDAKKK